MQEASITSAAKKEPPINNNIKKVQTQQQKNQSNTASKNTKFSGIPRSQQNNFELETDNDNWPEVDLGNLIIGLDADIDKTTMSNTTNSGTGGTGPVSMNLQVGGSGGGGSSTATATLTETLPGGATDKSLKMKIKRTKTGSRGNAEGKLEIVQQGDPGSGSEAGPVGSPLSNGSPDPIRLTASEIVAAVKQNVKPSSGSVPTGLSGASNKVRLTPITGVAPTVGPVGSNGSKKVVSSVPGMVSVNSNSGSSGGVPVKPVEKSSNGSMNPVKSFSTTPFASGSASLPHFAGGQAAHLQSHNQSQVAPGNSAAAPDGNKVNNSKQQQQHPQGAGPSASKPTPVFSAQSTSKASNEPPTKKQKVDASVGTEMGTMTEPDCLGPLDPGTSVTLEGIVWHETDGGVLVINVTWRGKTYVGTLLDSTRHVNQWAPPRYSDSPTSELDGRTPKGRGKRSRGGGTPVETETRKNLRSSKVKGRGNASQANSPAKRKGRPGEGGDEKRARTDSSRNSPDDDEDSEKEQREGSKEKENNESDRESTSSTKVKEEKEEDFTPKDKEEERYIPPPPLPFILTCPKSGCKKRYRHHNGLRFHVSHSHPELLDINGEIKDSEEIERMELEEKERLTKEGVEKSESQTETLTDSSASGPSSKTSTPGPVDATVANQPQQPQDIPIDATKTPITQGTPAPVNKPIAIPVDVKPIPVSEGIVNPPPRPPMPGLSAPSSGLPPNYKSPAGGSIVSNVKPIRPPSNARPIVPATVPQLMAGGGPLGTSAINLKPIQPRPTIMADPTPNLSLDELRKSKKEMKKKKDSPGNSPPRNGAPLAMNRPAPKPGNGKVEAPVSVYGSTAAMASAAAANANSQMAAEKAAGEAKSPAYSDISDDNDEGSGDKRKLEHSLEASKALVQQQPQQQMASLSVGNLVGSPSVPPQNLPPPPTSAPQAPPAHFFSPYSLPGTSPVSSLPSPSVPVNVPKSEPSSPKPMKKEPSSQVASSGPMPGTIEYQKMLEAYGFPPFPYPIPQGMDPNYHLQLLTADPNYRAKYERERTEKERAFKEQIDRDNREKDRRAGVKIHDEPRKTPEDLRKHGGGSRTPTASPRGNTSSGMISVKPEFRVDPKQEQKPPVTIDEGVKPTMETRGPPPSTAYNFLHPAFFRPPGIPYEHLLPPGLLSLQGYGPNPYLAPHLAAAAAAAGYRPPFLPPGAGPEDLSRAAAAAAAAVSGGSSATKALDLLHQHASQYYSNAANSVSAGLGSPLSAHKIHELHERALKSPSSGKSSPAPSLGSQAPSSMSQMTSLSTGTTVTSATTTKSSTDLSGSRNKDIPSPSIASSRLTPTSRGRSPPPLRHVHTHTHTHYGLGYPLLPPPPGAVPGVPAVPGVAPPAHASFPSAGFPASLLPGKSPLPGSLPPFPPSK